MSVATGLFAAAATLLAPVPVVQRAAWNSSFGQGIAEFSTGQWDAKSGAAFLFNCNTLDDTASLMTQISGIAPPAGGTLTIAVAGRTPSVHRFKVNGQGGVELGPIASSQSGRKLWAALRGGTGATIRYSDGSVGKISLAGAARTLPAKVCG